MGAMLWVSRHEQQHRGHGPLLRVEVPLPPGGDVDPVRTSRRSSAAAAALIAINAGVA